MTSSLKTKTVNTLKWNTVDRLSSQVLYAVVGIVLANVLSKQDFGLVGALTVFQAFAILFVDSGFGAALLQKKEPTQRDYSTVFWFNLIISIIVYLLLWVSAPAIADIFQGDRRLIPMSRVMFLTFILNGLAIVQTNRLMKMMDVKMIAVANTVGLIAGGAAGIWLALTGAGAWALVWQSVILAFVKSLILWGTGRWLPRAGFHLSSLKEIFPVGMGVFSSSLLNTIFLNIYPFVIGAFYSLSSLGLYSQADKWSKMGTASLSQILTASFVPLLSKFQDDTATCHRYISRINSFTAFLLFPFMAVLAVTAMPLFNTMFANKWDAAVILFQILSIRGIFIVLTSLANNYLLALKHPRAMVATEIIKDGATLAAIFATIGFHSVDVLVAGQLAASMITYAVVEVIKCRATGYSYRRTLHDILPFIWTTAAAAIIALASGYVIKRVIPLHEVSAHIAGAVVLISEIIAGGAAYLILLKTTRSQTLEEALAMLRGRLSRKNHCRIGNSD